MALRQLYEIFSTVAISMAILALCLISIPPFHIGIIQAEGTI